MSLAFPQILLACFIFLVIVPSSVITVTLVNFLEM